MTKELGLKVSAGKIRIKKIRKTNVPVLAKKKDGEYLLILNHNNQKWMILDPIKGTPESIDEESLFDLLGAILLCLEISIISNLIMVHRNLDFCVLLAVFVIQIFGIMTPLMTQVVVRCYQSILMS